MARSYRSTRSDYWLDLLREYPQSGLTVQAYCESKRVSANSFYQWRQKLRGKLVEAPPAIVPVTLLPDPPRAAASFVQVLTPSGFVLRVDASIPPEALARLLRATESASERGEPC